MSWQNIQVTLRTVGTICKSRCKYYSFRHSFYSLQEEPDSSSAAAKSSGDESTEKTTNKTLTTNTDPYDFDSQEALKKSKVVKLKISSSYWCL